jgi:hypothetical protein
LPDTFSVRVFADGEAKLELRTARLVVRSDQVLSGFPVTRGPLNEGLTVDGEILHLAPRGWVSGRLYMPIRPLEVRLFAAPPTPPLAGVELGFHAIGMPMDDFQRRHVAAEDLAGPWPLKKTAFIAPDVREGILFVRGGVVRNLGIQRLSVHDACQLREYRNPKPLAHGLFLYENPRAVPRAYTADQVVAVTDLAEVRRTMLAFDESELGKKVVLESAVVVRSDHGPTLLVTNDRHDPQWRATIDGVPTPILRANGIVRAVVVPQGKHRVRFDYVVPRAVWLGVASALLGLLLAALVVPALHRAGTLGR